MIAAAKARAKAATAKAREIALKYIEATKKKQKEIVNRISKISSSEEEKKELENINTEFNRVLSKIINKIREIKQVNNIRSIIKNDLLKLQQDIFNKLLDIINKKKREETNKNNKLKLLELSNGLSEMINPTK
jgi:DNA-directed RNA polymerase subunit F